MTHFVGHGVSNIISTHFNIIDKIDVDPNRIIIQIKITAMSFCLLCGHLLFMTIIMFHGFNNDYLSVFVTRVIYC